MQLEFVRVEDWAFKVIANATTNENRMDDRGGVPMITNLHGPIERRLTVKPVNEIDFSEG